LKKLRQQQKIGYFQKLIFGSNLNISGRLAYNVSLGLFSEKKSRLGMKSETTKLSFQEKAMNCTWF
jgi:hypothetical protein